MEDLIEFNQFITKNIKIEKSDGDRRIFTGHITAEIVDHQNDFIFVKEVLDIMNTYMKVMPVVSDAHSNRIVGKTLEYAKSEIEGVPSVMVKIEIFKQEGVVLYDQVWEKIKSKEYQGLSMGGGSKYKEPIMKDGKLAMNLKNLELYEIAVCPSPANPLAIIDKFNEFAKANNVESKVHNIDGRNIIQCSSIPCTFDKGLNKDIDIDDDNEPAGNVVGEVGEDTRRESVVSTNSQIMTDTKKQQVPDLKVSEAGHRVTDEAKVEAKKLEQFDKPPENKIAKSFFVEYTKILRDKIKSNNEIIEKLRSEILG